MTFIAVICGLKSEAAAVRHAIGDDARIRIGVSGANAARAQTIAAKFCAEGARAILSVGVSGGLHPKLQPGALVIGDAVVASGDASWSSDERLLAVAAADYSAHSRESGNLERSEQLDSRFRGNERGVGEAAAQGRTGGIFGSDEIIASAEDKSALFEKLGCLAVDMESHGAARAAAGASIPFVAIRAIADPADRALPLAALGAVAPDGSTRVLKTLGAALRDPRQFPMLIKLGADSGAALKTLRRDLGPVFRRLFLALDL